MRYRLAQVAFVALAWLLTAAGSVNGQAAAPDIRPDGSCAPSSASIDEPSGPEISVANVTFSGFLQLPISGQNEIASSITQQTYGSASPDNVSEEALERARIGWQDHGYFKAQVNGYATTLTSTPISRRISLSIHIDEGLQYSLGGISSKGNTAISDLAALRALFPIKEGDIFSREKIAKGLENLRKAYGEMGYIDFTSIPDTKFDDERRLIYLDIDINEGRQFYVGEIDVIGLSDAAREELLKSVPMMRGQIFNSRLWELTQKLGSKVTNCGCAENPAVMPDERQGMVNLTFDFRPCLAEK